MITITTPFVPEFMPILPKEHTQKHALYFDIETTGLSAQSSYVYLIGCAYEKESTFYLTQWMCTDPSEEKELLRLFFDTAKNYNLLLHYNGTGFDLPFLEKKAKRHCLTCPLSSMENLDLYGIARKLKAYLPTEDLKLKTMEQLFGFTRTDIFSGGDLIEVYAQFLGLHRLNSLTNGAKAKEVEALTQVLLLHNAEDIKNLPSLTVLSFLQNLSSHLTPDRLLPPPPSTKDPEVLEALKKINLAPVAFSVLYRFPFTLPQDFTLRFPFDGRDISLTFTTHGDVMLTLPVFTGELKYFYPNPTDYYYLPLEDCAMHKSVASFVEKQYRKKATAATCYTKKEGSFLPLRNKKEAPEEFASFPCFLSDYKSNFCYTTHSDELRADADKLTLLVKCLLDSFL